jgi:hypothetical protein
MPVNSFLAMRFSKASAVKLSPFFSENADDVFAAIEVGIMMMMMMVVNNRLEAIRKPIVDVCLCSYLYQVSAALGTRNFDFVAAQSAQNFIEELVRAFRAVARVR